MHFLGIEPKTVRCSAEVVTVPPTSAPKEDSGVTQADSKDIMYWFLAAGQIEPGKTGQSSSVKSELGHVLQTSQAFHQWANQKMKGYLGDGPHGVVQQGPATGGLADYSVQ